MLIIIFLYFLYVKELLRKIYFQAFNVRYLDKLIIVRIYLYMIICNLHFKEVMFFKQITDNPKKRRQTLLKIIFIILSKENANNYIMYCINQNKNQDIILVYKSGVFIWKKVPFDISANTEQPWIFLKNGKLENNYQLDMICWELSAKFSETAVSEIVYFPPYVHLCQTVDVTKLYHGRVHLCECVLLPSCYAELRANVVCVSMRMRQGPKSPSGALGKDISLL